MTDDDARFRAWMRANLATAAARLRVRPAGAVRWGWRWRSISSAVTDETGARCWLRVAAERHSDLQWAMPMWTGIPDSDAIPGIVKPRVIAGLAWDAPERGRAVRADLMTWLPGRACSPEEVLRRPLALSPDWWRQLRATLLALQAVRTDRWADLPPGRGVERVREVFGDTAAASARVTRRATGHGDLHWANLLAPRFALLDWEMWGQIPAGADAAGLYLRAMLVPETARRVREALGDLLDTAEGRAAQIQAAAGLIARGEWPELEHVLRRHVAGLLVGATA